MGPYVYHGPSGPGPNIGPGKGRMRMPRGVSHGIICLLRRCLQGAASSMWAMGPPLAQGTCLHCERHSKSNIYIAARFEWFSTPLSVLLRVRRGALAMGCVFQGAPAHAAQGKRTLMPHRAFHCNITAAWAVDREFVYIVGPAWAPFGRLGPPLGSHWDAFGATLVSLWFPLGCFGSPLTGLWTPVGRLGTPLGSIWSALGPRGSMWGPIGWQARFGDLASAKVM